MDRKHPIKITHLEYPPHPWLTDDEPQVAVEQPDPLQCADEHAEAERVDECDTGEVEHKTLMAGAHDLDYVLTQFGRADDVEFTGHGEHRPGVGDASVHDDVHPGHGIGPHAGDSVTRLP